MARVIYGVSGEGSGHSSRAREMIAHMETGGHAVKVVSYDRGYKNLAGDFDVLEIEGLHIATEENKVALVETFVDNLKRLPEAVKRFRGLRDLFDTFQPQVVITDFEPTTAYLANHLDLPLVTLDNQHRMRYMSYPCPVSLKKDGLVTETVVRLMVPKPDVSLVTTFYFGEIKNARTFLFPPILRREVLELQPTREDVVLVYATQAFESLVERLRGVPGESFLVYGFDRDAVEGNLRFRPFSQEGFLADLARCKAVIATAGFTLMTESLHLGKPVLALPMRRQFEQELNALLLETAGYGKNGRGLTDEIVAEFLGGLDGFVERLREYGSGGNDLIEAKLDELLAHDCALAREFHQARSS